MSTTFTCRTSLGRGHLKRQSGITVLSVLLGLAISALVAAGTIQADITRSKIDDGNIQGDVLNLVKEANNTYALENYPALQSNLAVTKNGVTLNPGNAIGQTMSPQVGDLVAMGYLSPGVNAVSLKIPNGVYRVLFQRVPAGCAPAACNISGTVYIDQPWVRFDDGQQDATAIGSFITKVGGDALVSLNTNSAILVSPSGATSPNPVAGNPAGVVGARVGFGSGGFGRFLTIGDPRDPGFQGGMTLGGVNAGGNTLQVNGSMGVAGTATFAGASNFRADVTVTDPSAGTVCVRLLVAGQIDINCNGILNAKLGTFTGPAGTVKVGNTGTLFSVDSTGSVRGQTGFFSAVGSVFGDNTLGIRAAGTGFTIQTGTGIDAFSVQDAGRTGSRNSLATQAVGLSDPVVAGSACGTPATEVPLTLVTNAATTVIRAVLGGGIATCVNGRWNTVAQSASPGSACGPDGTAATSNVDGRALSCKKGVYMQVSDLLSNFVLMGTLRVRNNDVVDRPICGQLGAGIGVSLPILMGQVEASPSASFNRRVDEISPTQWRVVLQDASGAPLLGNPAAEALFYSYCYY